MHNLKHQALRIRFARALTGHSRTALCSKHNISYSTMCLWENPNIAKGANLSLGGAELLCKIFQAEGIRCNSNWLLSGMGSPPEAINMINDVSFSDKKPEFKKALKYMLSWQVLDDSMLPLYCKNELVFFKEISRRAVTSKNAYLTIDNNNNKSFTMVTIAEGKFILHTNRPEETRQAEISKVYCPIACCI